MWYVNLVPSNRMSAGGISQEGRLCLKVLIVISTEGIVVNKSKEHEIGIGKR